MDELKRVFICLPVSEEVIKETARIQEQLKNKLKFVGKTTELENLHLTLKFLGEISESTLEKVKDSLSKIKFGSIRLKLGSIGTFSYKNQPKIIWLKILGDAFKVQKEIDSALESIFLKEERFMSHMTIARIKYVKELKYAKEYLKHIKPKSVSWNLDKILLMESALKENGPTYSLIKEYECVKNI